jgi:hypothetical protein
MTCKFVSGLNAYYKRSQYDGAEKDILSQVGGMCYRVEKI